MRTPLSRAEDGQLGLCPRSCEIARRAGRVRRRVTVPSAFGGRGGSPDRSGRRPGHRSTSRSIPTSRRSDHGEYARPPRAGRAQPERRAPCSQITERYAGRPSAQTLRGISGRERYPLPVSRPGELAIDRQTQDIAIETRASIEVWRAQQNPAAQDVHVPILARCPAVADAKASIPICRREGHALGNHGAVLGRSRVTGLTVLRILEAWPGARTHWLLSGRRLRWP